MLFAFIICGMEDKIYQMVKNTIIHNQMILPGDCILIGLSGGADSVGLLLLLDKVREEIPFSMMAVHVNHKVRKEAMKDAEFSRELCKRIACPFIYREVDMDAYAKEKHISSEEAGRILRYQIFDQELDKLDLPPGKAKIAVAHNQNDNAETVLFHLFRGSSLQGLTGIHPVRGRIIRPLIELSRQQIEEYLIQKKQSFCTDRTNLGDDYARNRIRHHILTYAEEEISSRTTQHICQAAKDILEAQEYIHKQAEMLMDNCVEIRGEELCIRLEAFLSAERLIQKQVLLLALERAVGMRKDIGNVHIMQVYDLCVNAGNREIHLPYGLVAKREYDMLRLMSKKEGSLVQTDTCRKLMIPGEVRIGDFVFKASILEEFDRKNIPENRCTKWFDYDKIKKCLEIRTRKKGDFLCINDQNAKKNLNRYFIDEKIPSEKRAQILLIAEESHVLWVSGYRISSYYKVSERTKKVLQVEITGGIENE